MFRCTNNTSLDVFVSALVVLSVVGFCWESAFAQSDDFIPSSERPADAIVLFDSAGSCDFVSKNGTPTDWPIQDGTLVSKRDNMRSNHIVSQTLFQDADIHVEFCTTEQAGGNSGVYIHGLYEMQIINSAEKVELTDRDEGALYGIAAPLVNAAGKPGEWQTYDIRYTAPRRDKDGNYTAEGVVSVWLNGKKVLDNAHFTEPYSKYHPYRYGSTDYLKKLYDNMMETGQGPLFLQDHDNPCRFRNVWIKVRQ